MEVSCGAAILRSTTMEVSCGAAILANGPVLNLTVFWLEVAHHGHGRHAVGAVGAGEGARQARIWRRTFRKDDGRGIPVGCSQLRGPDVGVLTLVAVGPIIVGVHLIIVTASHEA